MMTMTEIGLMAILTLVFFGPFFFHVIESQLEIFLLIMGVAALSLIQGWNSHIIHEALTHPIPITITVLGAGILFRWLKPSLKRFLQMTERSISMPILICCLIIFLGLLSSIITAIIAALVLVEIVSVLDLNRKAQVYISIIGCFSIGLGAVLTPVGEPLSTIVVSKLNVGFWFLAQNFSALIIPAILILGLFSPWFIGKHTHSGTPIRSEDNHYTAILIRSLKVYIFVLSLIFLGAGFKPIVDKYVVQLSSPVLYWINISSAILDNATLSAAEVSPTMTLVQLKSILMALLISGGMLIPGNIPNIIVAHRLHIKSKEWAKIGVPIGLVIFLVYFVLLEVL